MGCPGKGAGSTEVGSASSGDSILCGVLDLLLLDERCIVSLNSLIYLLPLNIRFGADVGFDFAVCAAIWASSCLMSSAVDEVEAEAEVEVKVEEEVEVEVEEEKEED